MIMQKTDQSQAFELLFNTGKNVREKKIIR